MPNWTPNRSMPITETMQKYVRPKRHRASSSEYAANLDIPLQIDLIEVTEMATANKSLTLIAPFLVGGSSAPIEAYDPEFANLAALYREALVSNTPAYRYLCFYKILEASRKRRERLAES